MRAFQAVALHCTVLLSIFSVFDLLFLDNAGYVGHVSNETALAEFYESNKANHKLLPVLDPSDNGLSITVWYLEHLLAAWVLERSPWNAYHSGIGFLVEDKATRKKSYYTVDFGPRITGEISPILHPVMFPLYPRWMPHVLGLGYAYVFASYQMYWENEGTLRYHAEDDGFPSKYTNFTLVGKINPKQFNHIREWFLRYQEDHQTFEPVEVIMHAESEVGLPSSMCHDLFYNALNELHRVGFAPNPSDWILRDHIFVFAKSYELVDETDWRTRREIARFYRFFLMFMDSINDNFVSIREMLASAEAVNTTAFLYWNRSYYRVELVNPWVNYCYLPVKMPPEKSSFWKDEHQCAQSEAVPAEEVKSTLPWISMMLHTLDGILDNEFILTTVVLLMSHVVITARVF